MFEVRKSWKLHPLNEYKAFGHSKSPTKQKENEMSDQTPEYYADVFSVGYYRWSTRVNAYLSLMRDEYPPFTGKE